MNHTRRVPIPGHFFIGYLFCPLCLVIVLGCGSKSEEKSVVPPPDPPAKTETDSSTTDPPGAIVLPEGGIPAEDGDTPAEDPEGKSDNQGLQLPDKPIEPDPDKASDTAKAKVEIASWQDIEKRATTTKRITVVDVWSTVCAPCIKEFPGLVELHKTQGEKIQCISVDVDFDGRKNRPPKYYEPAIVGFLTKQGADFTNFICSTPSDEVFETLDIVSIPAVLIYDADGKLIKRFIDADETAGFTYEKDIVPFLEGLSG